VDGRSSKLLYSEPIPPPRAVPEELTWLLLMTESVIVALPAVVLMPPADVAPSAAYGNHLVREGIARNTSPTDLR
jgi:hypothetical protein